MTLEKMTRINFLFDFYQSLLTEKQKQYMELYYLDDLSLGEIAEEYGVSRQAVYDNVRRTEVMLEEYEKKLHLFSKFQKRMAIVGQLEQLLSVPQADQAELLELVSAIKEHE